jgi:hypothetical protein
MINRSPSLRSRTSFTGSSRSRGILSAWLRPFRNRRAILSVCTYSPGRPSGAAYAKGISPINAGAPPLTRSRGAAFAGNRRERDREGGTFRVPRSGRGKRRERRLIRKRCRLAPSPCLQIAAGESGSGPEVCGGASRSSGRPGTGRDSREALLSGKAFRRCLDGRSRRFAFKSRSSEGVTATHRPSGRR